VIPASEPVRAGAVDPADTRPALRGIESTFGAALICPAVREAMEGLDLGYHGLSRTNLVTRSAPMGAVNAQVVAATFYNFNPSLAEDIFPQVWEKAPPERILEVFREAWSPVLLAALAPVDRSELGELAGLARTAADTASGNAEGRPLLAGLASLPWPKEDHLVIWHAGKVLREHRGDGHLAALIVEGLSGIEALVIHSAFDELPPDALRKSRRWDEESWQAAVTGLRRRGWLTDDEQPTLTTGGWRRRQWIEDKTDELAAPAFEPLGPGGTARMRELGDKVAAAMEQAGLGLAVWPARRRQH
jgi:hypothetical protein